MRVVVLVDGEHYPPGVRAAIGQLRARGDDIVAAVYCGGIEKLKPGDLDAAYGVYVERGDRPEDVLARVLSEREADAVVDLADEPALPIAGRFRLAAVALHAGAVYRGPDFTFEPAQLEPVLTKPSVRVIATGKRSGKTAIAGALARHAKAAGRSPLIVAMGRGGPDEPQVVERAPSIEELIALADAGLHASSDYLEDAVTSGVATIGCRRVGGGLAGRPWTSNVIAGARIAEARAEDLVILEGSGSAVPPVAANTGIIVIPSTIEASQLAAYLNPYRLLLSDLAVLTMGTSPADDVISAVRAASRSIEVVSTVFRPTPLQPVTGRAFYCTTAPATTNAALREQLELVGITNALADRARLIDDLERAPEFDVLLTEIKAAAIDVAARWALAHGKQVVLCDNEPVGDGLRDAFDGVLERASGSSSRIPPPGATT